MNPGRQRQLTQLAIATAVAAVGLAAGGTAGPLLAAEMTRDQLAGVPIVSLTAGSAASAPLIASIGTLRGRVAGLRVAHLLGAVGAAGAVFAAAAHSFSLLLAATLLLGAGNTAIFLSRYAAMDLAADDLVARSMGVVLSATAVGAVASPLLLGPTGRLATGMGLPAFAGLYLLAAGTYTLAAALLPRHGAPAYRNTARGTARGDTTRTAGLPSALTALGLLATTNLLMVGVMSIAPVHLVDHHMDADAVGLVVAAHVAAMFGPSRLSGLLADRAGPLPTAAIGFAMLVVAGGVGASITSSASSSYAVAALVSLGLGWNLSVVGGSFLLSRSSTPRGRQHLEAVGELVMGIGAATGAPLAALALSYGLGTVWVIEAALATCAAAALIVAHRCQLLTTSTHGERAVR